MIDKLNPTTVHEPAGYSHVTISNVGRLAHLAGQCPLDRSGEVVGEPGDYAAQTVQVSTNCLAVLESAGATPADVVRSVIYVVSPDSGVLSAVWRQLNASPLAPAFTAASTFAGCGVYRPGAGVALDRPGFPEAAATVGGLPSGADIAGVSPGTGFGGR
jgi:enamine deaminase RidA (YjgF/YER057c/UK114 family)